MSADKIKYGLKNVYYSKITESSGSDTYGTPVALPGAVSLSLDIKGDESTFYADNYGYFTQFANQGYEGDLELALIPDSFRKDILGETEDSNYVLKEMSNVTTSRFALLFEFQGDVNEIKHVLYNCTCSRPGIEGNTKEESIEPATETLSIVASPRSDGLTKMKTTPNTTASVLSGWYTSVYVPVTSSVSE